MFRGGNNLLFHFLNIQLKICSPMIFHSLIQLAQSSVDMPDVVDQFLPEFTDRPEIAGLFSRILYPTSGFHNPWKVEKNKF